MKILKEDVNELHVPPLEDEMLLEEGSALPLTVERPRGKDGREKPSFHRVFPRTPLMMSKAGTLARFVRLVGSSEAMLHDTELNDPRRMDLDAACFLMLILDLSDLFGSMACHANYRVKIKDLVEFSN